jgi:hypothetical protein
MNHGTHADEAIPPTRCVRICDTDLLILCTRGDLSHVRVKVRVSASPGPRLSLSLTLLLIHGFTGAPRRLVVHPVLPLRCYRSVGPGPSVTTET